MKLTTYLTIGATLLLAVGCGSGGSKKEAKESPTAAAPSHRLTMPVPPAMLTSDSARMDYVASHYWESMDMSDATWVADTAALEQAFANYTDVLTRVPAVRAESHLTAFYRRAEATPALRDRLLQIAERYLYDPNSPLRNEELYIPVLQYIVASPSIDEMNKIRPQYQLDMALKNRPGAVAADFGYTTADGSKGRLSRVKGEYTILMFYNPDCADCARVKEYIASSQVIAPLVASGGVKVLALYPDEDLKLWRQRLPQMPAGWTVGYNTGMYTSQLYDLRAIPCLYLLDKQKRVILKDAPVEQVAAWLSKK